MTLSKILLNTYRPLIYTSYGEEASSKYRIPPYVDASIRREPDLESKYPTISALCRGSRCAPRLDKGDIIIYLTVKRHYEESEKNWKLVAILKVIKRCSDHEEGYEWFRKRNLPTPKNCLIACNPPLPIQFTEGLGSRRMNQIQKKDKNAKRIILQRALELWDNEYRERVELFPVFIITKPIYVNYLNPVPLFERDMIRIFGYFPSTRTPPEITTQNLHDLIKLIGNARPTS